MKKGSSSKKSGEPKIVKIELRQVFMPFREMVVDAMRSSAGGLGMMIPSEEEWLGGDFVIAKVFAEDGKYGMGEMFLWLPETGVSVEQVIDAVVNGLSGYLLGESPFKVERIKYRMDSNVTRSEVAKGMLDMACYDLAGKITGRPASDFMGGAVADEVPLAAMVPLMKTPDDMAIFGRAFQGAGAKTLRVKLGRNINDDVRIMSAIREATGEGMRLRVDYNQAYTAAQAVRAIKAIEPFGVDCAEQPLRVIDYIGMAYVQKRVDTPLMAHEGCFSLTDIMTLIELGAIGVVGINAERPGGVTSALKAINYAEQRGMGVVIHNQSLGIASAMQIHLAAAKLNCLGHDIDLFGHVMMEDDLIKEEIDYSGGTATVPQGPGWGVELDEAALEKYAKSKPVVIEPK